MSDSYIQVATDSSGKKVQTFEHVVGYDTVEAQAVVLVDSSGNPYTPLTSLLASNTARVDPSGDDDTGTVGDLGKPFLTVQAAITALENFPGGPPSDPIIDIGNNDFEEDLTTSLTRISFRGPSATRSAYAFNSIIFTETTAPVTIGFFFIGIGFVTASTIGGLTLSPDDAYCSNVVNSTGPVSVFADFSDCDVGSVTAAGKIKLGGLSAVGNVISSTGDTIEISGCCPRFAETDGTYSPGRSPNVNSATSTVYANGSLIQITACNVLHLIDSRVIGTNNASSTVYADVLLDGDDTAYDATSWNGDTRTPSKNAVRDKFETLGTLSTQNGTFSGTHSGASSGTNTGDQDLTNYSSIGLAAGLAIALG